jgi:UDP-glucose 4-epimerase
MKKILITGASSFIGTSFDVWLGNYPDRYSIDKVSIRGDEWKRKDFSVYDVVFHVAGIAHKKETKKNAGLYYRVNRNLTYEVANKAKNAGVKQFIFLSSMSVYGIESGVIDKYTPINPKSNYGKSKLQAEAMIKPLGDGGFKIAIIRPPMIYGQGCKGNYPRLANLSLKTPFFPNIENKRSMIYIDNFCEFIRLLIDDCSKGIFFPQNSEYVNTSEMVKMIAEAHGKKIRLTKLFNSLLVFRKFNIVNKVFGNLVYEKEMSKYKKNYQIYNFRESIKTTEI